MEEPRKEASEMSDSELFDAAVNQEDTQTHEDAASSVMSGEGMEKTTPEAPSVTPSTPVANPAPVAAPVAAAAPEVATQPVAPAATEPTVAVAPKQHGSGGVLVLQWLSYAFWGWFGFSLTVLSGITIGYFFEGKAGDFLGSTLAYPLAAVIVMLIISLTTDFFYARHEPVVKSGAANVIMLLHVVVYLLTAVGALITIVFAGISMFLADANSYTDGHNGQKIAMLTALMVAVVFGSMAARMLFGGKKLHIRKLFWLLMSVLALAAIISSVVGPAAKLTMTKDDRLIEEALPTLARDIDDYVQTNDRLPTSLSDVKSTGYSKLDTENVQLMISKKLVTYKPNTKPSTRDDATVMPMEGTTSTTTKNQPTTRIVSPRPSQFYYQLCVTYKEEKNPDYYYRNDSYGSPSYESSSISTYSHPKGEKCYDLMSSGKYSYNY